jgi:pumilio homology domain family member 6
MNKKKFDGGGKSFDGKKSKFGDKKKFGGDKPKFNGEKKFGGGKPKFNGEKKFGDKKFGDKKFGDKKFGDKKFGDKKFGDKKFNGDKKFAGKPKFSNDKSKSSDQKSADDNKDKEGDKKRKFDGKSPKHNKKDLHNVVIKSDGDKKSNKKFKSSHDDKKKQQDPASYRTMKPHFKLVETIKTSWNRVRDHSTPAEERQKLVADMVKNIKSHVLDVTLRHDASRMVQTILQFGSDQQKELVLNELNEKMFEIAKTPYGHFAILKAITYCNQQASMKKIVTALQKHFVSLGTHVIGARTVESILQLYPANLTRALKAEFYGKNFSILLAETPKGLRDLIEQLPNKRQSVLDHMRDLIQKLAQKQLLEFTYVHHLLYEYSQELQLLLDQATSSSAGHDEGELKKVQQRVDDLVNQLADSAPKLLSTKPGAKVMCFVIAQATAKDRKRVMKSLKGHVLESLLHDSAFLGVLRVVDVTDDTVNVQKSFFDELKGLEQTITYTAVGDIAKQLEAPWLAIAKHPNASKLLLRLLAPTRRHLEPDEESLFATRAAHSKKDADVRRREHVTYLRSTLLKVLSPHVEALLRSRSGAKVLEALVQCYHSEDLVENVAKAVSGVTIDAVEVDDEQVEAGDEEEEEDEDEDDDVLEDEFNEVEEEDEAEEGNDDVEQELVEGDEEYDEQLREAEEDLKAAAAEKKAKTNKVVEEVLHLLPIEEDPVAHIVLKRLLRWESQCETTSDSRSSELNEAVSVLVSYEQQQQKDKERDNVDNATVDKSQWVSKSEVSEVSLAHSLWNYLSANDYSLLKQWVTHNRPSFALHELLRVPSVFVHIGHLFQDLSDELSEVKLQQHEGGKTLLRLHDAFVAAQEAKKKSVKKDDLKDKKKKVATPKKK